MAVECMSRAIRLAVGINVQNDPRDLVPVCALCVGIEQPQVSHQMFLIVTRQGRNRWRHVGNVGVERGFLNRHPGTRRVTSGDNADPLTKVHSLGMPRLGKRWQASKYTL